MKTGILLVVFLVSNTNHTNSAKYFSNMGKKTRKNLLIFR